MTSKRSMLMSIFALTMILLLAPIPQALANDEHDISTSDIIALLESLKNEGEFTNENALRVLTMHLTAVDHYERHGDTDKVVEHMNSFKLLLDHQLNQELISASAYDVLMEHTDVVIQRWDQLTIVSEGQANAVIIVPKDPDNTHIPGWSRRGPNPIGKINVVDTNSYSGNHSLYVNDDDGDGYGLLSQYVAAEAGESYTVRAMTYRETGTNPVIMVRFFDDSRTLISSEIDAAGIVGEWTEMSVTGIAPEGTAYVAVYIFTDSIGIRSFYMDDIELTRGDDELNLLYNPGFELIPSATAEPLIEYITKSTGVEIPVMTAEPSAYNGVSIYIGHSRAEDETRHQDVLQDLNVHGFIVDVQEDNITMIGTTDKATEFAVYDFLERYVGVRWLMPGPDGVHVPQHSTLNIPRGLVQEEPATVSRHFFGMAGGPNQEWYTYNRFHHNISFHHNMNNLFDPEVFADHPEYYSGGVVPTVQHFWQPCFNDETADAAINRIIEYFDDNPDASSYSLGINDGRSYCEEEGHPDYPTELNSVGKLNRSDLYYPWVNQIVEGVTAVYPDKYFGLLAYREMFDPPKNEDGTPYMLHPNVVPYITDDRMAWGDPNVEAAGKANTEGWAQVAENLGFYEYFYGASYNVPRVYMQQMADNYQFGHDHGVIGHVAELYPNWGEGAKPWVSAKLQWNPNQDVDVLLNEWYVSAVGEAAAPYLQQYYEIWEQFWSSQVFESAWYLDWVNAAERNNYLSFIDQRYLLEITKEDVAAARNLLEQAVVHAETDEQQTRAELLLRSFELYEASALSYPFNEPVDAPTDEEAALEMLEDIKTSVDMAAKRYALIEEFTGHPFLALQTRIRGEWNGVQRFQFSALKEYVENEPVDGPVGDLVEQFLAELPEDLRIQFLDEIPDLRNLSANAVKTTASKEDILQTLDFSQGPWAEAEPFNEFFIMSSTSSPIVETKVYLLWDDENLYVGYENFDNDQEGMRISEDAPNGWWRDGTNDSVETFITNNPIEPFLGFFTNPIAVGFSRYQSGPEPVQWEANANIEEDRWNVIQVIPFDSIGVNPDQHDTLMGFFFRNYHGSNSYLGWGGGNPWNPESFRPIHLIERNPNIPGWSRRGVDPIDNIYVVDSMSYSGQQSLYFDDNDSNSYGLLSRYAEIMGGESYTAQAMVYRETGSRPSLVIQFYDENRIMIDSQSIGGGHIGTWAEVSVTAEAPEEAAYAAVYFFSDTIGIRSFYIDDVELKQVESDQNLLENPGFEL